MDKLTFVAVAGKIDGQNEDGTEDRNYKYISENFEHPEGAIREWKINASYHFNEIEIYLGDTKIGLFVPY